jgi:hypothetical protein
VEVTSGIPRGWSFQWFDLCPQSIKRVNASEQWEIRRENCCHFRGFFFNKSKVEAHLVGSHWSSVTSTTRKRADTRSAISPTKLRLVSRALLLLSLVPKVIDQNPARCEFDLFVVSFWQGQSSR